MIAMSRAVLEATLLVCILHLVLRNSTQQRMDWPCINNQCFDRSPCTGDFTCPPPPCTVDSDCDSGGAKCEPVPGSTDKVCGQHINFARKPLDSACTLHNECRTQLLCFRNRCKATTRIGSFFSCARDTDCDTASMEECFQPNMGGVCLLVSSNPDPFQLDQSATATGVCANTAIGKDDGPCKTPDQSCDVPLMCVSGCCAKTTQNRNGKGQRVPPQQGDPNCRDALDSGESDPTRSKCADKRRLCANPVYRELMREQCPRTCGYCDGQGPTAEEDWQGDDDNDLQGASANLIGDTVKVNPGAACSDRKLPGRQSDCPRQRNLCTDPTYEPLMRVQCPQTCGFC